MLISLRSKGASWMIKILFGFLILSFAAWGVPDLYQAIQPQAIAANVGDTEISADELRKAVDTGRLNELATEVKEFKSAHQPA